jgi:hypothetical protein
VPEIAPDFSHRDAVLRAALVAKLAQQDAQLASY